MKKAVGRLIAFLVVLSVSASIAQSTPQQTPKTENAPPETTATFRSFTRLVTIQVVAKDRHGHHLEGLKPEDFQVFEENADGKEKRAQKISTFQEVHFAELAKQAPPPMKVPAGVYTNAVTLQKNPVPPTIILVDGMNTDIKDQAQIRVQVERIVNAIPKNTPVAIFLLGWQLRLLQDFSTDPESLKMALKKANSAVSAGLFLGDPTDDPNEAANQLYDLVGHESDITGGGGDPATAAVNAQIQIMASAAAGLAALNYKNTMDRRVKATLEALTTVGHYVAGYPGRKNLLWISSSFPIMLAGTGLADKGYASYEAQIRRAANVLSDAKVAIYPVNPAGVQPHAVYGADARPSNYSGQGMADTMSREIMMLGNQDRVMQVIAQETGAVACNGSNDLGECLTRAFDDSSSYYEISYYPDSQEWNGAYRMIILKTKRSGVDLEYRHGYFAGQRPDENPKMELQQAACTGYLSSTSVVFAATKLPADNTGQLRFYVDIDPQTITLSPTDDGGRNFSIEVAACSFDNKGKPLKLLSQPISGKLSAKEYQTVEQNGLAHVMAIPAPLPAGVRLVVKDVPSNHIGSVHINLDRVTAAKAGDVKPASTKAQ